MEYLKRNFINSFTEEVANLNGTEFEYLCKPVLSMIIKDEVELKGHNLCAKPVGYTADFIANEFRVIGQCGTEPDYFEDLTKPIKDIHRAIVNHPQCETIYLFANQRGTGGQLTKLNNKVKDENISKNVITYDIERTANIVLENINSTTKIEEILQRLPKTSELYKILPESNKLPSFKSKYYYRSEEEEILKILETYNHVQIFGVSGVGKTELSISLANRLLKNFETTIWIDGDTLERNGLSFLSMHVSKFKQNINLEFLLKRHKTLLIVDNFNSDVQQFINQFSEVNQKESKCIISSLQRDLSTNESFALGFLSKDIAREILLACSIKPSDLIIEKIINEVHGYPLVLILIKSAVENDDFSWSDIVNEIESISDFIDDKNQKLSDRIIGKFLGTIKKELSLVGLLGNKKLSRHYLEYALGKTGVKALEKRSLLSIQDSYYYSIHHLILISIQDKVDPAEYQKKHEEKLLSYLLEHNEIKSLHYFNFLFTHYEFIKKIYDRLLLNNNLKKAVLYAIIQFQDLFFLSDWVLSELLKFSLTSPTDYLDIVLYIEQKEIELFQLKSNNIAHDTLCNETILFMERLLEDVSDLKNKALLLHHIGKFYNKSKNHIKAKEFFLKVLDIVPNADYSLLQIARIEAKEKNFEIAKDIVDKVLDQVIDIERQSLAILLSFYELIGQHELAESRLKHLNQKPDFFLKILLFSLDSKFDHPYRVLEKLSSHLAYTMPATFEAICEVLPFPSNVESNKQLMQAYATIQLELYRMLKFNNQENSIKEKRMSEIFSVSENYFLSAKLQNDFARKKLLTLYLTSEEGDKALKLLEDFQDKGDLFFFQSQCKAYRLVKNYPDALNAIEKAIINMNKLSKSFQAAFLNDKAETLRAMNNKLCLDILQDAIHLQSTHKTIDSWKVKLEEWKEQLQ